MTLSNCSLSHPAKIYWKLIVCGTLYWALGIQRWVRHDPYIFRAYLNVWRKRQIWHQMCSHWESGQVYSGQHVVLLCCTLPGGSHTLFSMWMAALGYNVRRTTWLFWEESQKGFTEDETLELSLEVMSRYTNIEEHCREWPRQGVNYRYGKTRVKWTRGGVVGDEVEDGGRSQKEVSWVPFQGVEMHPVSAGESLKDFKYVSDLHFWKFTLKVMWKMDLYRERVTWRTRS